MSKPVICIGAALVDELFHATSEMLLATTNDATVTKTTGGVSRNIAHQLALLGVPVFFGPHMQNFADIVAAFEKAHHLPVFRLGRAECQMPDAAQRDLRLEPAWAAVRLRVMRQLAADALAHVDDRLARAATHRLRGVEPEFERLAAARAR